MRLQGDSGLYLSGSQVQIPSCGLYVTQPTIKQIVQFGESDFFTAVKMIGESEEVFSSMRESNPKMYDFNDFQILLEIIQSEDEYLKGIFNKFFMLCFPNYKIEYNKNSINFKLEEDDTQLVGIIQMYNFKDFSIVIYELFSPPDTKDNSFNPANDLAKKIAKKLEEARLKKTKQKDGSKNFQSLFSFYTSILSIGLQMDINIFYNYTPFQLYDAFSRFISKQECDFYQKVALQPFASTENMDEPDNWQRNLYK